MFYNTWSDYNWIIYDSPTFKFFGTDNSKLDRLKGQPTTALKPGVKDKKFEKKPPRWFDRFLDKQWLIYNIILYSIIGALYIPTLMRLGTLHWQEFTRDKVDKLSFPLTEAVPFSFKMQLEENSIVQAMRDNDKAKYEHFPDYWYEG